ncbi:MAG: hypothetical protein ACP5O8_04040 [Candidatus Aenigmatarchaeota archaeon]
MIDQLKALAALVKRLYRKPVYGSTVREERILVDGRTQKVDNFVFYTSYPYDESRAIVIKCQKNSLGEKVKELEKYCEQRDLMLANILRYCRENRVDVPTDYLDHLERADLKTLRKILKNLEQDLADPQIASSKKRCLVLYYTVENGENVVCGGGITLYPLPSNKPEEILPAEKFEKLRRVVPWEQEVREEEVKEMIEGLEEDEEYPSYDFEIKD